MTEVKLPTPVVEQLTGRARVVVTNAVERAAAEPDFDLTRSLTRSTLAALSKVAFRSTKAAVELVEANARAAGDRKTREALLQVAARLAEGCHFNGSPLFVATEGEKESEG